MKPAAPRALLSPYDKTGLVAFARGLVELGWELVASGNTGRALGEAEVAHLTVESVTGSPELLGGRVKTLHPRIHAGILADLADPGHREQLAGEGVAPIGIVVGGFYPFEANPSIEMIDIGGPTMVRAAAKNHRHVAVIVDPSDYGPVLDELRREGGVSDETRLRLARTAFDRVAAYDAAIATWMGALVPPAGEVALPPAIHLTLELEQVLSYGENPHQAGARYRAVTGPGAAGGGGWAAGAVQHGGRELSYLNLFDADFAWRLAHELLSLRPTSAGGGAAWPAGGPLAAAVVVKHANPSGAAVAWPARGEGSPRDLAAAYQSAVDADSQSAFGGIVALTGPVDRELAERLVDNPLADVVVAPSFDEEAVALLGARRRNTRLLSAAPPGPPGLGLRQIDGSYLVQEPDLSRRPPAEWTVPTRAVPSPDQRLDAELAFLVCARTSSNAVVLASKGRVLGVGCGQQSRVDAARLAAAKAGGRAEGGAGASDAFFPFRDGLDVLADAGAAVVVQPGGSLRDDEIVRAADERNIAMLMTKERHFRH